MSYSDSKPVFLRNIVNRYPDIQIELEEINPPDFIPIFFILFSNDKQLTETWSDLNLYIAVNFQTILESEFSTWNIYLFFMLPSPVKKSLKYKIENDTFSSRKIVIESEITHQNIISEHILNDNLQVMEKGQAKDEFVKNSVISSILEGRIIKGRKKILAEADVVITEIKNALKG